jgi:hypothetical protein
MPTPIVDFTRDEMKQLQAEQGAGHSHSYVFHQRHNLVVISDFIFG